MISRRRAKLTFCCCSMSRQPEAGRFVRVLPEQQQPGWHESDATTEDEEMPESEEDTDNSSDSESTLLGRQKKKRKPTVIPSGKSKDREKLNKALVKVITQSGQPKVMKPEPSAKVHSTFTPSKVKAPEPFIEADSESWLRADAWKEWVNDFEKWLNQGVGHPDQTQKAELISMYVGKDIKKKMLELELYPTSGTVPGKNPYDKLVESMSTLFEGLTSRTIRVDKFHAMKQREGQPFQEYVMGLKRLAAGCNIQVSSESFISQLYKGMLDVELRRQAEEEDLGLEAIMSRATVRENRKMEEQPARCFEVRARRPERDHSESAKRRRIDDREIEQRNYRGGERFRRGRSWGGERAQQRGSSGYDGGGQSNRHGARSGSRLDKPRAVCTACDDGRCTGANCRARTSACYKCSKVGHFARCCPQNRSGTNRVHAVEEEPREQVRSGDLIM